MIKIYRKPGTNVSFEYQLQRAGMSDNADGIRIVETLAGDVDVICAATARELLPFIVSFGKTFRYLLWCDEPLWLGLERVDPASFKKQIQLQHGVKISVITHANNSLKWHWKVFLASDYMPGNVYCLGDSVYNKAIFLAQHRAGNPFKFCMPNNSSLCLDRAKLAVRAWMQDMCDISGNDWPANIASYAITRDGNWVAAKLHTISLYRYNISSENSFCTNYVTEKIWHAIYAGCLPIYHFGSHYSDPHLQRAMNELRSVCVDCSSATPEEIIGQMKSMSDMEYNKRIEHARAVLDWILPAGASFHQQGEETVKELKEVLEC